MNFQYGPNCEISDYHFQTVWMRFGHIFHNFQEDLALCNKHVLESLFNTSVKTNFLKNEKKVFK